MAIANFWKIDLSTGARKRVRVKRVHFGSLSPWTRVTDKAQVRPGDRIRYAPPPVKKTKDELYSPIKAATSISKQDKFFGREGPDNDAGKQLLEINGVGEEHLQLYWFSKCILRYTPQKIVNLEVCRKLLFEIRFWLALEWPRDALPEMLLRDVFVPFDSPDRKSDHYFFEEVYFIYDGVCEVSLLDLGAFLHHWHRQGASVAGVFRSTLPVGFVPDARKRCEVCAREVLGAVQERRTSEEKGGTEGNSVKEDGALANAEKKAAVDDGSPNASSEATNPVLRFFAENAVCTFDPVRAVPLAWQLAENSETLAEVSSHVADTSATPSVINDGTGLRTHSKTMEEEDVQLLVRPDGALDAVFLNHSPYCGRSPHFLAPEQAYNFARVRSGGGKGSGISAAVPTTQSVNKITPAADVFAFGLVVAQVLTELWTSYSRLLERKGGLLNAEDVCMTSEGPVQAESPSSGEAGDRGPELSERSTFAAVAAFGPPAGAGVERPLWQRVLLTLGPAALYFAQGPDVVDGKKRRVGQESSGRRTFSGADLATMRKFVEDFYAPLPCSAIFSRKERFLNFSVKNAPVFPGVLASLPGFVGNSVEASAAARRRRTASSSSEEEDEEEEEEDLDDGRDFFTDLRGPLEHGLLALEPRDRFAKIGESFAQLFPAFDPDAQLKKKAAARGRTWFDEFPKDLPADLHSVIFFFNTRVMVA